MKKLMLLFLIVMMSLSLLIIGCSDDDDDDNNGTTTPSINPSDYDYAFSINRIDYKQKSTYTIMLWSVDSSIIDTLSLTIDGEPVMLSSYAGTDWSGSIAGLNPGTEHSFALTINAKGSYNFDLMLPYSPMVTWPETINLSESNLFNWTLEADSYYQAFSGYAYAEDWDDDEDNYQELDPSARSYNMPANWLSSGFMYYSFSVYEYNYEFKNNLLCFATDGKMTEYSTKKLISESSLDNQTVKNIAKHIVK